jgi:hypothetical protein
LYATKPVAFHKWHLTVTLMILLAFTTEQYFPVWSMVILTPFNA